MNPNDIYQKAIKALGNIGQKVVNTPVLPFLPQSVNLKNIATRPPGTFTPLDPGSLYGNFQQDPKGAIMNTVMALSAAPVPAKSALSKISNMDRKVMGDFVEAIESGRAKQPLDELGVNAANIAKGLGVPETATNQTIANHFNNAIKAMDEQGIQPIIEPDTWKAAQKVVQNKPSTGGEIETLYRGEGSGGMGSKANGNYYSTDKEFAREFTRLMSDKEIKQIKVPKNAIYEPKELPFAGNEKEITQAINEARQKGFNAIRVSEGAEQPNSVFIIDPKKPISIPSSGEIPKRTK